MADDVVQEHRDQNHAMRQRWAANPNLCDAPLLQWYVETDAVAGLELVEDDWLQNKDLWRVDHDWTWAHIYEFLALLTIDSAVYLIERNTPFKAAVSSSRASEYHGIANAVKWTSAAETTSASSLGKLGSDVRHASNRAAKSEAIGLYTSRSWTSQAHAARIIAGQVHKTEKVVEKWLREYRKGADVDPSVPL